MPIPRAVAVVVRDDRVLLIKRFRRHSSTDSCTRYRLVPAAGEPCPGHHYAVLPGGHVEDGESAETAALRELTEETSLRARVSHLLWTGMHNERPASYFLMADVTGTPRLSGPEADFQGPDNRYDLLWATADDFGPLNLHPAEVHTPLAELLHDGSPVPAHPGAG
ncbi:NUDIX domain-containing protein [Nocardiopsis flavescens]|uniref:NUDIX domain-containing protein n=1 Tax=Nocardiopsis flavescens TaxID=758803 RepID=UPI00365E9EA9